MSATAAESAQPEVLFERRGPHIAVLTLNRPEVRNAVNAALANRLDALVKETEADSTIRVVILASSHEKVFCAGADLSEVAKGRGASLVTPDGGFAGVVYANRRKPWIAAVRGAALGGGCELMLACDLAVVSDDVRIGLPEVKRGLIAGAGGVYRLPRALPRAIALEMLATGEPLGADRAYALGLVNLVVPAAEVLEAAVGLAEKIAGNAPMSVLESLDIGRVAVERSEPSMRDMSAAAAARVMASDDLKEGVKAFLEKRPPVWTGK